LAAHRAPVIHLQCCFKPIGICYNKHVASSAPRTF
jgi:hypothetical protein